MERPFIKKLDLYTFVKRLLKRFKDSCSINRKEGLGRPGSVITEENTHLVEELTFSQEEALRTHPVPRQNAKKTGISCSSIKRMIKKKNLLLIQKNKKFPKWMMCVAIEDTLTP